MEGTKARVNAAELRQFISFRIGREEYGLELLRVKEVIRLREITRLPTAPAWVKGIINLRGDVIPIIALRDRLGLEGREATTDTRVIVVEIDGRLLGMVVDSASQVVRIPAAQIDPPPRMPGGLAREFISGVGKQEDRLVILLNVDALLSRGERTDLGALEENAA